MYPKIITLLVGWLLPLLAFSQILDDSTQQVYGPTTTRYILESDLLENRNRVFTVDTALTDFHTFISYVARNKNRYQDLGILGSALFPVFYTPPTQIGTYLGLTAYDPYAIDADEIKYFDTKSPYTSASFAQADRQQLLDVEFSRNVTPNWNLGLRYQRIVVDNVFAPPPTSTVRGDQDRMLDHHAVALNMRYFTKDSTYQILAHLSHLNHYYSDKGGISPFATDKLDSLFDYGEELSKLVAARSRDYRNNHHVYHQYAFARGFQLFHRLDINKHTYDFFDPALGRDTSSRNFYPDIYFRGDTSYQKVVHYEYENRFGIKGSLGKMDYRLFARRRDYNIRYQPAYLRKLTGGENFLGAWINLNISDSARLTAEAEYRLFRDYRISATFETRFWRVGHSRVFRSPTLIERQTVNNHFIWENSGFSPVLSDHTFAYLRLKTNWLEFSPFATFTNWNDFIYYDTTAAPRQSGEAIQILTAGAQLNVRFFKHFYLENYGVYTRVTGNTYPVRIPEWFANARLYYQNFLFKKALFLQVGVDVHYKSAYFANAYMPVLQQFYVQDNFSVGSYLVADAFISGRISRVRIFAKLIHGNQDFPERGYFVTPYFYGMPRMFSFGLNWLLFD